MFESLFTVNEHFFKWTTSMLYYSTTRDTVRVIIIWFPAEFASWLTYKEINSVYLKKKNFELNCIFPYTTDQPIDISVYYVNNTHLSTESFLPI